MIFKEVWLGKVVGTGGWYKQDLFLIRLAWDAFMMKERSPVGLGVAPG